MRPAALHAVNSSLLLGTHLLQDLKLLDVFGGGETQLLLVSREEGVLESLRLANLKETLGLESLGGLGLPVLVKLFLYRGAAPEGKLVDGKLGVLFPVNDVGSPIRVVYVVLVDSVGGCIAGLIKFDLPLPGRGLEGLELGLGEGQHLHLVLVPQHGLPFLDEAVALEALPLEALDDLLLVGGVDGLGVGVVDYGVDWLAAVRVRVLCAPRALLHVELLL